MADDTLNVMAVVGSLNKSAVTRQVINHMAERMRGPGVVVDVLDLLSEPLALFNPDTARESEGFSGLKQRVERADVYILGTPDYHGSISSAMKNFLDHFWHEFAGKLFVTIVASHEKGLTVTDQLRTVARQCYAWTLPYGASFSDQLDFKDGQIVNEGFKQRLEMMMQDARTYGRVLAQQRKHDLAGTAPGFMAKHRR
jgi:NAD(P)H-dependent FMN reductase